MSKAEFTTFRNLVAGKLRNGTSTVRAVDPTTREPLWEVPLASSSDLDDAVVAGRESWRTWSQTPWTERQRCLSRAIDLLQENRADMAQLLSREVGRPIQFADLEVEHAINFLTFFAKEPPLETRVVQDDTEIRLTVHYEPLGIIGAIVPWNYPLVLAVGKIAPALLAGNCVIAKPSPFTPYSLLKFAELVSPAFPPSVLQVLNGDDTLGPRICEHSGVDKISFTGSTETGKKIMAAASKSLKSVTLELGGNSASIICPDVDVDVVAPQVALGSFFNSGQLCVASKRVYVHRNIYDRFLDKFVSTVRSWGVGLPGKDQDVMLGPIQNEMQYNKVKSLYEETARSGAKFALGGGQDFENSNYLIQPTVIQEPADDSRVVQVEAFGPIVPIQSWTEEDEVLARVNNTQTGLGGAVWSADIDTANRIASRIDAGTVWINSFEKPLPQAHLSGRKESGLGGEWGREGLSAYCQPKVVHHYKNIVGHKP